MKLPKIKISFLLLAGILCGGLLQAQYEEKENESVDEYRKEIEFSYPKYGSAAHNHLNDSQELGHGEGDVIVDAPKQLGQLINICISDEATETIEGYRVQIYAGGNLEMANDTRADFIEIYPEMASYRLWVQPTFRIRVGDFPNRGQANLFCSELRKHFPGAFVVPDKVKRPTIKRKNIEEHGEVDPDQLKDEKMDDKKDKPNR